jgi:hypothetical protein
MLLIDWIYERLASLRRDRRRAQWARYSRSEKGRMRSARYDYSDKGRERHRWCNTTTNGRLRNATYRNHVNLMWTSHGRNHRRNVPERRSRADLVQHRPTREHVIITDCTTTQNSG